jgi:hypothetical protein
MPSVERVAMASVETSRVCVNDASEQNLVGLGINFRAMARNGIFA